MFANEDIYVKNTDPTVTINPKIVGAFYINSKTAVVWVCIDNTINKNVWKRTGYTLEEIWDYVNPKIPKPTPIFQGVYKIYDYSKGDRYPVNTWLTNTTNYYMDITFSSIFQASSANDIFVYIKKSNKEYNISGDCNEYWTSVSVMIPPKTVYKLVATENSALRVTIVN